MKLIIEDDEGRKTVIPLVREEISIGRLEGNTIRLTERNVSRHHARLFKQSGAIIIEDLGSSNGVRVNGERIAAKTRVHDGDLIEIGDYDLAIEGVPRLETATDPQVSLRRGDTEVTAPPDGAKDVVRDLPPERMPALVGLHGAIWGEEFPLTRTVISFGRAADINDIAFDDPSVSRTHGKFKLEGETWKIYDSQSSHGVRVNGEQVSVSTIRPGDVIEIGDARLRFCAPGESFTPPQNEDEATLVYQGQSKSKASLVAGILAAVVIAAGAAWFFLHSSGTPKPSDGPVENHCQKAQAAMDAKNWAEAVQSLSVVKQLGTQCPFPIEPALQTAQANQEVKTALDEADTLLQHGKYRQVIDSLSKVPAGSVYGDAAKAKMIEARDTGEKQLSLQAQAALDKGHVEEASSIINELQAIKPDSATLPFLQKQFAEKKEAAVRAAAAAKANEPAANGTATAPNAVATAATPPGEDRTKVAKQDILDGIDAMKAGNFDAGRRKLEEAIRIAPDDDTKALAHKNLGVGCARQHQTDDAISHLKIYLKLKPNAPDRAKFEQIIQQIEAQQK